MKEEVRKNYLLLRKILFEQQNWILKVPTLCSAGRRDCRVKHAFDALSAKHDFDRSAKRTITEVKIQLLKSPDLSELTGHK